MPRANSLKLVVNNNQNSKKSIKMELFLNKQKIQDEFEDTSKLLIGLDKILKTNKVGTAALRSFTFKVECPGTETSLSCKTARLIIKTIQHFNFK